MDYVLNDTDLHVTDEAMTRERWAAVLDEVKPARGAQWHLGDLLAFGERTYGDGTYQAAASILGYEIGSLRNLASVSRQVPPEVRQPDLPWRTHRVIAKLDAPEQKRWLALAASEGWTSDRLRQEIDGGSDAEPETTGETVVEMPTGENDDLDPWEHWDAFDGPEYDQPEMPFKVVVNCETEADRDGFLASIGSPTVHNRNGKTCSVWFPDRPKDDVQSVEFVKAGAAA